MPLPTPRQAFRLFHLTLGAVVLFESVDTALHAMTRLDIPIPHVALLIIASVEAVAALLFLVPATFRLGGKALLGILLLALVIHGLHGQFEPTLLVYAAGTLLVLVQRDGFGSAAGPARGGGG